MARNRKNQSPGLMFGPALKAAVLCAFILICCVGYVWQKKQINELSHQIGSLEAQRYDLHDKNEKLRKQIAVLGSPPALDARAKELGLGLTRAQPSQIWRLPEPVADTPAVPKVERQFASGRTGAVAAAVMGQ